jgi:hypothetical protein
VILLGRVVDVLKSLEASKLIRPEFAKSKLNKLLRFSSTPLPGRIKLFDLEVRADIDGRASE